MRTFAILLLCASPAHAISLYDCGGRPGPGVDNTAALLRAIAACDGETDLVEIGRGEWHFTGPVSLDQEAASEVTLRGLNIRWDWQHREGWQKAKPKTSIVIHGLKQGQAWWTQEQRPNREPRGPAIFEGLAFIIPDDEAGGVFCFGDMSDDTAKGGDARGNAIRYCSFHGPLYATDYFVRGNRQYNFEIDHCSFRGMSGIELSGDMPTLSHLRMGHHVIAIRTFNNGGHDHVPGTISDVEIEGVSGTGICVAGDSLHRCSVETGYAFVPPAPDAEAGRVVRFGDRFAVLGADGWLGREDKCPASFVQGETPSLVPQVPAVIAGNRCSVADCRFEFNRGGLDSPQFVVVPYRSPIRINGVPELYGLGREKTNRPAVSAWCEGTQHCLFGQVLTDHLQLCEDAHPLVNSKQPFDPNWGAYSTAANGESQALQFRRRDGRWVYRLSDAAKGWTRRTGGVANVWADGDRVLTLWDGVRKIEYKLAGGWTRLDLPAGNLRGDGIEVEL